jgi:hypothetical protein
MFETKVRAFERTHDNILNEYWDEIESTFTSLDAIPPSIHDITDSNRFRYCQSNHKKDRKKVGYICRLGWNGQYPFVKITVNHFRLGKSTFNSIARDLEKRDSNQQSKNTKTTNLAYPKHIVDALHQEKQDKQARLDEIDAQKQQQRFLTMLAQWENATGDISQHPYAIKKQLTNHPLMRQAGNLLLYPLTHLETGKITGIQSINVNGDKRFYGQQKGTVSVLGEIDKAHKVYLCEGYATANAVMHLTEGNTAIVNTLNCHNLVATALYIKRHFLGKKIIIAADNDQATCKEGKGNAGLWYASKACLLTQATLLIPQNINGHNVDWCDVWINSPLEAERTFSERNRFSLKDIALNRLSYASLKTASSEVLSAVRDVFGLFLNDYPLKISEEQLLEKVQLALTPFNIKSSTVKSLWVRVKKQHFAKALRVKTFTLNPKDNRYHVQAFDSMNNLADAVEQLKSLHPKAIFITNASMGTGKTQTLMMPQFKQAERAGMHPIIITPTQALTKNVASLFQTAHYQKERDSLRDKKGLAITINSIIQEPFDAFLEKSQSLFIDEYTQVLRSITSGTVKPSARQTTHQRLSDLIAKSAYVTIADADFNAIALNDVIASTHKDTPIFVMTLEKVEEKSPYALYPCSTQEGNITALHLMQDALEKKEPCYVVTDSRKKIAVLTEYLKEQGVHPLVVSAESIKTPAVQGFIQQPDVFLTHQMPQVVIVSPAIQSGLSIESGYFKRLIGIYTGTVAPSVFAQMLNRVRNPLVREVILPQNHGKTYLSENADALLTESYAHYIQRFGAQHPFFNKQTGITHIGSLSLKHTDQGLIIQGDPVFERFERLLSQLKALEHQQKNQAQAFFALQRMADGEKVTIEKTQLNSVIKNTLKAQQETAEQSAIDARYNALCGQNTLTETTYLQLKKAESNTLHEVHAIERFEIANTLQIKEITPSDINFYDHEGKTVLENYEDLKNGLEKAKRKDEIEQQQAISKQDLNHCVSKVTLLNLLFKTLGLSVDTGAGCYSKSKALALRNAIRQEVSLSRYVLLKLSLSVNSSLSDVAFTNKVLKKLLGLKANRYMVREGNLRKWIYSVKASFEPLIHYVTLRENEMSTTGSKNICHHKSLYSI